VNGHNIAPLVDTSLLPRTNGDERVVSAAHRLYEHLIALWAPGVIEAAHDLGVFAELANGPRSSEELARHLDTDLRTTRILLDALYAYEVLERERAADRTLRYVLTEEMRACLLPGGLFSLVGKITYDRNVAWGAWRDLAQAVRTGGRDTTGQLRENQISQTDYQSLAGGINFWAPPIVEILAQGLKGFGWSDGRNRKMLDVGCGTGLYSQLLLSHFPSLEATGLDAESIVPVAMEQSRRLGVEDRFAVEACDFWKSAWGDSFDVVFFANIFHLQTSEQAQELTGLAAKALAEDGLVVIVDHIVDAERKVATPQDRFAILFAASMTATGGGDAYTLEDYDEWFARSGLKRVKVLETPMHRILFAGHA
jgi:SAM-dependent methyltransferase